MDQKEDQNNQASQAPQFTAPAPKSNTAFIIVVNAIISVIIAFIVTFAWQMFFDVKLERIGAMEKQVLGSMEDIQGVLEKTNKINIINK